MTVYKIRTTVYEISFNNQEGKTYLVIIFVLSLIILEYYFLS